MSSLFRAHLADQDRVFSFTSTSIVWPPTCCAGGVSAGDCSGALASFMPSLKPLTAPPRSCPTLRSFLVPKISITITRTISQCQMVEEIGRIASEIDLAIANSAWGLFKLIAALPADIFPEGRPDEGDFEKRQGLVDDDD